MDNISSGYSYDKPSGPTNAEHYMHQNEHLPPQGHAYTPDEYYAKTGIKSRKDLEDDDK